MPKFTLETEDSRRYTLELRPANLNIITRPSSCCIDKTKLGLYVTIRHNDQTTLKDKVPVFFHHAGGEPETHYKISEDPNLDNVRWLPFSVNVIWFKLSPSKGKKTIYCQTKNQYVESNVAEVTIELI